MATQDQDESPIPPEPPDAEAEKAALRQQINSLELRLAQVEAELAATRPAVGPVDVQAPLLLAFTCLLALVPPALVFVDRWLMNQRVLELFQTWWCRANIALPVGISFLLPHHLPLPAPVRAPGLDSRPPAARGLAAAPLDAGRRSAERRPLSAGQTLASRLLFAAAGVALRADRPASRDATSRPGVGAGAGVRGLSPRLGFSGRCRLPRSGQHCDGVKVR